MLRRPPRSTRTDTSFPTRRSSDLEFFIFDSVRWQNDPGRVFYEIGSEEAAWSSRYKYDGENHGHRPGVKGGSFPVSPVDSLGDLRADMCKVLESLGQTVAVPNHEVANAGQ